VGTWVDVERNGWAWREAGDGPLVVLLHGLGGSRTSWDPQLLGLADAFRVVAWDLPGYGAATPLATEPLTFAALADAVVAFVDELGADQVDGRAHLVGISFGGMIAQHTALAHPQRVASLALLATSPAFGLDGTTPEAWRAARLAPLDEGLEPVDIAPRVLAAIAGPHITTEQLAHQQAAMARVTGAALRRSIDVLVTHDTRARLHEITVPTLCLVGELDEETPPTYAYAIADRIPGAELAVVEGAGHLLNVEAPDTVNDALRAHLLAAEGRRR
jgi:3-oxoadipate enol-lactonase